MPQSKEKSMATAENSKARRAAVVVVHDPVRTGPSLLHSIPAALTSVLFHCGLIAVRVFLIPAPGQADGRKAQFEEDSAKQKLEEDTVVQPEEKLPPESKEPLVIDEVD